MKICSELHAYQKIAVQNSQNLGVLIMPEQLQVHRTMMKWKPLQLLALEYNRSWYNTWPTCMWWSCERMHSILGAEQKWSKQLGNAASSKYAILMASWHKLERHLPVFTDCLVIIHFHFEHFWRAQSWWHLKVQTLGKEVEGMQLTLKMTEMCIGNRVLTSYVNSSWFECAVNLTVSF